MEPNYLVQLAELVLGDFKAMPLGHMRNPAASHGFAADGQQPKIAIVDDNVDTIGRGLCYHSALADALAREFARLSNFEESVRDAWRERSRADAALAELMG